MADRVLELAEWIRRRSALDDLQGFVHAAKELAGRVIAEREGAAAGRPALGDAEYAVLREEVLVRDGYRCRHCLRSSALQVDHIVPRSLGGPDALDNLWTLCFQCHELKERGILRPVQDPSTARWRMLDTRRAG